MHRESTPPKCPIHRQPMRPKCLTSDGFETFGCIVKSCSVEIDQPLSRQPAAADPLHTDDPAQMTDPEL